MNTREDNEYELRAHSVEVLHRSPYTICNVTSTHIDLRGVLSVRGRQLLGDDVQHEPVLAVVGHQSGRRQYTWNIISIYISK